MKSIDDFKIQNLQNIIMRNGKCWGLECRFCILKDKKCRGKFDNINRFEKANELMLQLKFDLF
jgi:hypothetical protein